MAQKLITGPPVTYFEARRRVAERLDTEGIEHPEDVAIHVLAAISAEGWDIIAAGGATATPHGGAK